MGRKQGHATQFERIWSMLARLSGYRTGVRLDRLADELQVSERTLRRDILDCQRCNIEVEIEARDGRAHVHLATPFDRTALTPRERFTVVVLMKIVEMYRHTAIYEDLHAITEKLLGAFSTEMRAEIDALRSMIAYVPDGGARSYRRRQDVFDGLQTGIMQARLVRYRYRSSGGRVSRGLLAPLGLALYRNGLHVVARKHRNAKAADSSTRPTRFAVERFQSVTPIKGSTFTRPESLGLDTMFDGAFGFVMSPTAKPRRVVIEFSRHVRESILGRTFHPAQTIDKFPDGRVILSFEVRSLFEVTSWILGWGRHARVIEPASLATKIAEECFATVEKYANAEKETPTPSGSLGSGVT